MRRRHNGCRNAHRRAVAPFFYNDFHDVCAPCKLNVASLGACVICVNIVYTIEPTHHKMLHLVFERALQLNFDGFPKLDITQFSASIEQQGFK
jgi:hypothetical protein